MRSAMALAWALSTGALFAGNAAISGEFNYQGGDRKTFYSFTGFPFANDRETFESINPSERREAVLPTGVLAESAHAHGLPPQPGLFRRRPFQRIPAVFLSGCR